MNEVLYHYTNIPAALSILSNKSIWLSDCRFLNDSHEYYKAIDILLNSFDIKEEESKFINTVLTYSGYKEHHCIFSLSSNPKILSQWRTYSDDGRGVAIGFHRKSLEQSFNLFECIYENHELYIEDIRKKHLQTIDKIIYICNHFVGQHIVLELDKIVSEINLLARDLLRIKNSVFKEEKEVRIIKSYSYKDISFRNSNNIIVPYKDEVYAKYLDKFVDHSIYVREIWLGPKCNELNKISFGSMFISPFTNIYEFDCGYK
ncbi:hypothetical protein CRU98_01465 [Arcobacter sp. CECT 8986]|uniref:DUF2971 domain-containing protein n=1 Tax=Arcobacter sp. CECT 8986 TaxID=2044507 RepID=UPI001009F6D9|nr:DUF2971 domain-containing protein [Arcobacter sp. CECT 8986]RXK01143.1 hypothetical protein CRU98_01465 [Arcobacter sp. CECT 8986]